MKKIVLITLFLFPLYLVQAQYSSKSALDKFYKDDDVEGAKEDISKTIENIQKTEPTKSMAIEFYYLGLYDYSLTNYKEAIINLDRSISYPATFTTPDAFYRKSLILYANNQYDDALVAIQNAIKGVNITYRMEYILLRGLIYKKMGYPEKAKTDFEEIVKIEIPFWAKVFALYNLDQKKEAEKVFKRRLANDKTNSLPQLKAAAFMSLMGKKEESLFYLDRVFKMGIKKYLGDIAGSEDFEFIRNQPEFDQLFIKYAIKIPDAILNDRLAREDNDFMDAKSKGSNEGFDIFLAKYPESVRYKDKVLNLKNELLAWDSLDKSSNSNVDEFLLKYPDGNYYNEALKYKQVNLWNEAIKDTNIVLIDSYLLKYPDGEYFAVAKQIIEENLWKETLKDSSINGLEKFLAKFPEGKYSANAKDLLEDKYWEETVQDINTVSIEKYLVKYPSGKHIDEAMKYIEDENNKNSIFNAIISNSNGFYMLLPDSNKIRLKNIMHNPTVAFTFSNDLYSNTIRYLKVEDIKLGKFNYKETYSFSDLLGFEDYGKEIAESDEFAIKENQAKYINKLLEIYENYNTEYHKDYINGINGTYIFSENGSYFPIDKSSYDFDNEMLILSILNEPSWDEAWGKIYSWEGFYLKNFFSRHKYELQTNYMISLPISEAKRLFKSEEPIVYESIITAVPALGLSQSTVPYTPIVYTITNFNIIKITKRFYILSQWSDRLKTFIGAPIYSFDFISSEQTPLGDLYYNDWLKTFNEKQKNDSIRALNISIPYPKLPYFQKDICPFEGCQFGDWVAKENIAVYKEQNTQSAVVGNLKTGEHITAIKGDMVITQFGKVEIAKSFDEFREGDTVLILSYNGEGNYSIWDNGFIKDVFIFWEDVERGRGWEIKGEKLCPTISNWWVYVKLKSGVTGWVNNTKYLFKGTDAFD